MTVSSSDIQSLKSEAWDTADSWDDGILYYDWNILIFSAGAPLNLKDFS
jgi:hypothetical protein